MKALLIPAMLALSLEIYARLHGIGMDNLAPPSAVAAAWLESASDGSLARATIDTLAATLGGLLVGGTIGFVCSALFGLIPALGQAGSLVVEFLRPVPPVALLPIALLVFGFGFRMEILIVAFAAVWPVVLIGRHAIAEVDPRLIDVSRALRFSLFEHIFKIVLPASLPGFFVAFRLAAGISLIVAVTAEITLNPQGLGYELMTAQQTIRPESMCAILIWIGCVGWMLNQALIAIERRAFAWHRPKDKRI